MYTKGIDMIMYTCSLMTASLQICSVFIQLQLIVYILSLYFCRRQFGNACLFLALSCLFVCLNLHNVLFD